MFTQGKLCCAETLESRRLLADVAYAIYSVPVANGTALVISGALEADVITVRPDSAGLAVEDGAGNRTVISGQFQSIEIFGRRGPDSIEVDPSILLPATLYGGAGDDTILGGGGDDTIYTGRGGGVFRGRGGNDTLISLDSYSLLTLGGGGGRDSYWFNAVPGQWVNNLSQAELLDGAAHAVGTYQTLATAPASVGDKQPGTPNLPDPLVGQATYTYSDFSSRPLFSKYGPLATDVVQGAVGDCYLLAAFAAVAQTDPGIIRNAITQARDGTYVVRFERDGQDVYYRIDADLPVSGGALAYADTGAEGSIWVPLLEKAFAFFRRGDGQYASIGGGWMSEGLGALGMMSDSVWKVQDGQQLLTLIQQMLQQGKAVTFATYNPSGAPLVAYHAYSVDSVILDANGVPALLRLRNPWGVDGAGNDGANDGYVTITGDQALAAFWAVQAGYV